MNTPKSTKELAPDARELLSKYMAIAAVRKAEAERNNNQKGA